jgi:hypothetical protein
MKTQVRRGRPPRAVATAKALVGVDVSAVDPRAILRQIAGDCSAPATARVAACRALLAQSAGAPGANEDPITELALKLLKQRK